jgi:hypothetical protein
LRNANFHLCNVRTAFWMLTAERLTSTAEEAGAALVAMAKGVR